MNIATMPRGIDIASYQGRPDWDAVVASGIQFAFTKVTENDGYVNPFFARNWAEMRRVGIHHGAYHFARPVGNDAAVEADYFLDHVEEQGPIQTGEMLVLDIEAGSGDLGPWALAWCERVKERAGFSPIIYSGAWFTDPHGFPDDVGLAAYGLWLAAYGPTPPTPPAPWQFWAFWQYSDKGSVPGISGDVDLNMFNGPADRIALYGKPATDEPTEPDPPTVTLASVRAELVEYETHLAAAFDALQAEIAEIRASIPE